MQNKSTVWFGRMSKEMKRKIGFTLAEVLITLGIIGVVAAVTLPTLINNYKVKQFESAFKKTDNMIQEALRMSLNELGYTDIRDLNYERKSDEDVEEIRNNLQLTISKLNEVFLKQFKGIELLKEDCKSLCDKDIQRLTFMGEKYNSKCGGDCCYMDGFLHRDVGDYAYYTLPNGVTLSGVNYTERAGWGYSWAGFSITFDTNGPYKGPNREGYDIFKYYSSKNLTYIICNPITVNSHHNEGCYFYAHSNQSPLNSSESYWNLLYKPLSYWENYNN